MVKKQATIVVTAKTPLDLDGYACVFAYTELLNKIGKNAVGVVLGDPHKEIDFLNKEFNINSLLSDKDTILNAAQIILVDTSSLKGLPKAIDPQKVIEVVDHRDSPEVKKIFPNAKIQIEKIGAAATLIAEKFQKQNIPISKEAGILLCGTIGSHTHNFKTSITNQRDKIAYDWIAKTVNAPKDLIKKMLFIKSQFNNDSFEKAIINDVKEIEINKKLVGVAQLEVIGLRNIINQRKAQLFQILSKLKQDKKFDFIFLIAVDLEKDFNIFVANHEPSKILIEKALNISFKGKNITEKEGVILRKQITPLLRKSMNA